MHIQCSETPSTGRLSEMQMSLKEGEAYAALREAVASQIQEMKATCCI